MNVKDVKQIVLTCMPFFFMGIHNLDTTILLNSLKLKILNICVSLFLLL